MRGKSLWNGSSDRLGGLSLWINAPRWWTQWRISMSDWKTMLISMFGGVFFANESNHWLSISDLDSLHFKWWIPASFNNIGVYWCPLVITFAVFFSSICTWRSSQTSTGARFQKITRVPGSSPGKSSSCHHTIDISFSNYFLGVHEIPRFSPWGLAALLWPQERWKLWTAWNGEAMGKSIGKMWKLWKTCGKTWGWVN